jgi:hypothetical protein
LTLAWLAHHANAQDIQWRAATPTAPQTTSNVTIGQPSRLDGATNATFRPIIQAPSVIRAQGPDDKTTPAIPVLIGDKQQAKPLPKDNGFPPPPRPVSPTPIADALGCGDNHGASFGDRCCGPRFLGCFGSGHSDACCDRPRWWISGEYLMWFQRAQNVPPLVTASPAGQLDNIGVLGDPRTLVVYEDIVNHTRGGFRIDGGFWTQRFCNVGLGVTYFVLGRNSTSATFVSDGIQVARPFFDVILQTPDAEIASPGSISINTYSQFWGIDGTIRHRLRCSSNRWCDFLWGYRHLNLSEGIDIVEDQIDPVRGGRSIEQEAFHTRTQFNGAFIGLQGECKFWNRMFLGWTAKVAMGSSYQIVDISGTTTFIDPAIGTVTQQGALLASPTNIGHYTRHRFAVAPELGVKVGVDLTEHLRLFAGYDFLYLSNVVRPGDQIDLNVNPNFRPTIFGPGVGGGPRQPAVLFRSSDYWAQGFSFGLQYRY